MGGGAAVDGDDQLGAAVLDLAEGGGAGAVALEDTVGDIDRQVPAHGAEPADQLGGAAGPVDVVVGEDRYGPAADGGVDEDLRGAVHVGKTGRVGKQGLEGGIEEVPSPLGRDAARGQGPRQRLTEAMAQLVLAGDALIGGAAAPDAAGERLSDAQEVFRAGAVSHSGLASCALRERCGCGCS